MSGYPPRMRALAAVNSLSVSCPAACNLPSSANRPATKAAIAQLREWVPDYDPGATHVAMPVATARKLLAALDHEDYAPKWSATP